MLFDCGENKRADLIDGVEFGDGGEVLGAEDQAVVDSIAVGDIMESITLEGEEAVLADQADRVKAWNEVLD